MVREIEDFSVFMGRWLYVGFFCRQKLVFTDASPNDEWGISAFAQYTGKAAVEDVQAEIRSIEKKGIKVIAVFMGSDRNTETAKAIYGDSFVRITHIEQLAEALGAVIQKRLHVV